MKTVLTVLLIFVGSISVSIAGDIDTLLECRPNAVWKNKTVSLQNYSGPDFPDQAEWDACEVAASLRQARSDKKEEIKAEANIRAKLIDEDFSLNNIGIYKKISVASLDVDGVSIRSILVYAKQKMTWVDSASLQDVNAYDPTTDVGWP